MVGEVLAIELHLKISCHSLGIFPQIFYSTRTVAFNFRKFQLEQQRHNPTSNKMANTYGFRRVTIENSVELSTFGLFHHQHYIVSSIFFFAFGSEVMCRTCICHVCDTCFVTNTCLVKHPLYCLRYSIQLINQEFVRFVLNVINTSDCVHQTTSSFTSYLTLFQYYIKHKSILECSAWKMIVANISQSY